MTPRPPRLRFALPLLLVGTVFAGSREPSRAFVDSCNAIDRSAIFDALAPSIGLFRQAVDASRELGYAEGEAAALDHLSVALLLSGRYDESVEASLGAIRLFEELGHERELARAWGDLGYGIKRHDLSRATEAMRLGIGIAEDGGFDDLLEGLYNNFGVLHEFAGRLDSARVYYERALALAEAAPDSSGVPYCLNHLSGLASLEGDHERALGLLRRSDRLREASGGRYGWIENRVLWGDAWYAAGEPDSAERNYRLALTQPEARQQRQLMVWCLEKTAAIREARGDWRGALEDARAAMAWRDSLRSVEIDTRVAALELGYEAEKKDRQLAEGALELARRDRLLAGLVALVGALGTLALAALRAQKRRRERLRRELEFEASLERERAERRLADEKLRISRELHDNIGSQLTFLVGSLDNLGWREPEGALGARLAELSAFGRDTLSELRGTVWAMQRERASLREVRQRLAELGRRLGDGGPPTLEIVDRLEEGAETSAARALVLLRVAQEALANALKHAAATSIRATLVADGAGLRLDVVDDGCGFDPSAAAGGSGLASMRQRCEAQGGRFTIESGASGTRVSCEFPPESGIRRMENGASGG